jgi:hypothetical protein
VVRTGAEVVLSRNGLKTSATGRCTGAGGPWLARFLRTSMTCVPLNPVCCGGAYRSVCDLRAPFSLGTFTDKCGLGDRIMFLAREGLG